MGHLDFSVVPRHRDIGYADLALVAPAQLDAVVAGVLDQHHTFGFLAGRFQDHVVAFGFLDRQQLNLRLVGVDDHGQLRLANLAFEFLVIEVCGSANGFLLHLDLNPMLQALNVHCATRSGASTRVEQEIVLGLGLVQADFAAVDLLPVEIG